MRWYGGTWDWIGLGAGFPLDRFYSVFKVLGVSP